MYTRNGLAPRTSFPDIPWMIKVLTSGGGTVTSRKQVSYSQ